MYVHARVANAAHDIELLLGTATRLPVKRVC